MNELSVIQNRLSLDELESQAVAELPPRELMATFNLSVLGLVTAGGTLSLSTSVLGIVNASVT